MAALTDNKRVPTLDGSHKGVYGADVGGLVVLTGASFFRGSMLMLDVNGFVVPAGAATDHRMLLGKSMKEIAIAPAGTRVEVERGDFFWEVAGGTASTDIGSDMFPIDDQTASLTVGTSEPAIGTVVGAHPSGAYIQPRL